MHAEIRETLRTLVPKRPPLEFSEMLTDLVRLGISDVHVTLSVLKRTLTVEGRVDDDMQHVHTYTGVEATTLHTRLKTDSKMVTGANMLPEDGNYPLPIDGYPYRARVVSMPLFDGGDKITMRLPQLGKLRPLEQLGFTARNLHATKALLDTPGGLTLFAGPTGEGKSTTAQSSLEHMRLKSGGVFITLEDPVERVLEGVAQIEVKDDVEGAGYGDMMKYLVRSDPDGLFVGEVRDRRTATSVVELAKSGVSVIATIHATNNISAFLRLMEMADATPLSVLESINGVVSQRLLKRLTSDGQRFSGRYPVHEVTANSLDLTDALIRNHSRAEILSASAATSTTFRENVDELVAAGITTYEEAKRMVRDV